MTVAANQRFNRTNPCPVCAGFPELPTGHGRRCWGYLAEGGRYARCSRPEFAGQLAAGPDGMHPHRLNSTCNCGRDHETALVLPPKLRSARQSDNGELARRIWSEAQPIDGTPAATYLRARGLREPWPLSLRFAPSLRYSPTGFSMSALIAAVTTWPERHVCAIQRTFLMGDGSGKAPVSSPKMSLGPMAGGAVRLAPAGPTLVVAEGIENALTAMQESGLPAWATLGTANMPRVVLPDETLEILIAADPDEAGQRAAREAAELWTAEGRRVRIATPPPGCDFNDLVRSAA